MYTLRLPATTRALPVISAFVWAVAADAGLTHRAAYGLRLAVDELVTNILVHGYMAHRIDGSVRLNALIERERVVVLLRDTAPPYDISRHPSPSDLGLPPHQRSTGGLGVFLARHNVAGLTYVRLAGQNVITLFVYLAPHHDAGTFLHGASTV